ncbi:MAG: hypothetical protein ACN4E6_02620 [Qipengyuania pacifica]|jgi:anaerobic selenocysteine-containing dehydrogenase|tara:strand:+ start:881 stop:1912 length:1032 start_codon:yes stop_codon:yes gene_type:complete
MTRRKDPAETRIPVAAEDLPAFDSVPVKYRHDGWTPARQKAFIGALADTGSVSRAARYVNMSPEGAYYLRRRPGSESFRRAWEAALDLGVQRLKDIAYERAIDGQLSPVFVAGKLKGFRRIRNDRLLMFCLRMNARDERGKRLAASYFDSDAARLHGGTGTSSSSVAIGQTGTSSSSVTIGQTGTSSSSGAIGQTGTSSSSVAIGQTGTSSSSIAVGQTKTSSSSTAPLPNPKPVRLAVSYTLPALSRAEKDDMNAAMVEHFDPVDMSLAEIEAMQTQLAEIARRKRAEDDGPPDHAIDTPFTQLTSSDWKAAGELEDLIEVEDELEQWNEEEDHWRDNPGRE